MTHLLLLLIGIGLGSVATAVAFWAAAVREFADACDEHLLPVLDAFNHDR